MLNRSLINKKCQPISFRIKEERLILFAKATGQTDPIYFDENKARAKGYSALIAPPTFLTVLDNEKDNLFHYLSNLSIDLSKILHAGQIYKYYKPVFSGDVITMEGQIINIFDKNNGALQFFDFESKYSNQKRKVVAESLSTMVIRMNYE